MNAVNHRCRLSLMKCVILAIVLVHAFGGDAAVEVRKCARRGTQTDGSRDKNQGCSRNLQHCCCHVTLLSGAPRGTVVAGVQTLLRAHRLHRPDTSPGQAYSIDSEAVGIHLANSTDATVSSVTAAQAPHCRDVWVVVQP